MDETTADGWINFTMGAWWFCLWMPVFVIVGWGLTVLLQIALLWSFCVLFTWQANKSTLLSESTQFILFN